jgi:uncharacterized protein YecE (DUF72 family)
VHVVDPFVTQPEPGHPVYWRLHGITGPRHSYTDAELRQLQRMLVKTNQSKQGREADLAHVLFNNLPRVGDAKRFLRLLSE